MRPWRGYWVPRELCGRIITRGVDERLLRDFGQRVWGTVCAQLGKEGRVFPRDDLRPDRLGRKIRPGVSAPIPSLVV